MQGRKRVKLWCEVCDKHFRVYSTFYSHMRCKHRTPYVHCDHCDDKFFTVVERNRHFYRAQFGTKKRGRKTVCVRSPPEEPAEITPA